MCQHLLRPFRGPHDRTRIVGIPGRVEKSDLRRKRFKSSVAAKILDYQHAIAANTKTITNPPDIEISYSLGKRWPLIGGAHVAKYRGV
jgi:hypothetical protein